MNLAQTITLVIALVSPRCVGSPVAPPNTNRLYETPMPSRPVAPDRPTFYLDQSTLSDCFRSVFIEHELRSEDAYRELLAWVERVATEANLCLSHSHVIETSRWHHGNGMAAWLDSLEVVWLRSYPETQRAEDEHLVRLVGGVREPKLPSPFAPSFLTSFGQDVSTDAIAGMLAMPTVEAAVAALRERPEQRERQFMPDFHAALHADRAFVAERGITETQVRDRLEYNSRVALRRRAGEAHNRLVEKGDLAYLATGASWGSVQDPFVERYESDPIVLPTTRVITAYSAGFARETAGQKPGGQRTRRRHASGFYDLAHAAAAAHCDVFTCDELTGRCLGNVREQWTHSAPIARARDEAPPAFVRRLIDSWGHP